MGKLIAILSVLTLFACIQSKVNQGSHCQSITDIGVNRVYDYLETLDKIEPEIIEYRIGDSNEDYYYADMFVSKPYLKGQDLPIHYEKIKYKGKDIHLLIYCDNFSITVEDSLRIFSEIKTEDLVVEDVLEWTAYGEWSTQDFNRLKFIFCKNNIDNFTVNTRVQDVEKNLTKPNCP